jgi:hypothetical protein
VWVWYLSAGAVVLQLAIVLLYLRREFRVRLGATVPGGARRDVRAFSA